MRTWKSSATNLIIIVALVFLFMSFESEAAPTYSAHACTPDSYYQPNSSYASNLNLFLSSLTSNASHHHSFYRTTVNQGEIKGYFLCRPDVTSTLCHDCVTTAAKQITQLCTNTTESIIWYDECMLRYTNLSFLNNIVPGLELSNVNNISLSELQHFNDLLATTLKDIAAQASSSKFATKEAAIRGSQKLYTLAQCVPDLSSSDCNTCFQSAIASIPTGKQGARSLLPICYIRYELYPFYNQSGSSTQPVLLPSSKGGKSNISLIVAIVAPVCVAAALFILGCCILRQRSRKKYNSFARDSIREDLTDVESLQFDFATIEAATNCFSDENKIGQGGFGVVYKGVLPKGEEIAVKRLSLTSLQGAVEFRNEATLVAKLQHRNLVRLLGYCLEGREKMLVYEYIPNKSLDHFLFDPVKQKELDWSRRYKIITGIARGILYLHEDSQLRIIHRDLKASNVLLDENMNPKISDFGMAKIFEADQTQVNTGRIVGTYGYMSPEYAMRGQFSVKSDIFSFGVLVLEIVSGKRNTEFYQTHLADDLLSYAWKNWTQNTPLELLDPTLRGSYSRNEVIRCIHIGLLCVQESPSARPTMANILLMLNSASVTLSLPRQPASFLHGRKPNRPQDGHDSDQFTTSSIPWSINEVSITQLAPR